MSWLIGYMQDAPLHLRVYMAVCLAVVLVLNLAYLKEWIDNMPTKADCIKALGYVNNEITTLLLAKSSHTAHCEDDDCSICKRLRKRLKYLRSRRTALMQEGE